MARTDLRGLVIGYGYAPLEAIRHHSPTLVQLLTAHGAGVRAGT
jgi:hypothetical protein